VRGQGGATDGRRVPLMSGEDTGLPNHSVRRHGAVTRPTASDACVFCLLSSMGGGIALPGRRSSVLSGRAGRRVLCALTLVDSSIVPVCVLERALLWLAGPSGSMSKAACLDSELPDQQQACAQRCHHHPCTPTAALF